MKNSLFILLWFFLCITHVSGQLSLGFAEGTIVKKNGDTLKCFIELSMGYEIFVRYATEEDGSISTISTKQIRNISTQYQYYENIQVGKKEKLMALVAKGPLTLYKFIVFNDRVSPSGITIFGPPNIDYVIKKEGSYYEIKEKDFKNTLANFLNECTKVVQKLHTDVYKFNELEKAIKDYNNCDKPDSQIENEWKLLGEWKSDMSDNTTKNTIGEVLMTFTDDGRIIYDIIEIGEIQRLVLAYRIAGDSIISKQSSQSNEEITKFKFDGNDKLLLEINGVRSVFLRKIKQIKK